jgi:hypothetical protein
MKGFRTPAQPSAKVQLRQVQTELQNSNMAARVSQMMIQQLMNNVKSMSQDLGSALNQLYELQYKYTALQKYLNVDTAKLNTIANEQRLSDFNEASLKADDKDGLEAVSTVGDDSTVVLTSTATDETGNDRGIFRSRIKLSESGVPALIKALTGKSVGDKVNVKLNEIDHVVELLAITAPKAVTAVVNTTAATDQVEAPAAH